MSFPLKGNESVRKSLENAIASRRIPHAFMVEGAAGLGKHTLAHYIALAAVCEGGGLPCGECRGCHLAEVGSHPDISYIGPEDGKKNITVAQIRELRAEAFVKAHMAAHRVFVVESADRMNDQAQNALLKVLEEPPAGVIFILLVSSRTVMLETIVSRCTVLTLSVPCFEDALSAVAAKTKATPEAIGDALKKTGNNVGLAIGELSSKKEAPAKGAAEEFLRLLFSGSELDMLKVTHPFEKDRAIAEEFFSELKICIAKELKICYGNTIRAKVLTAFYSQISEYEGLLKTNINLSLLFSAAVCKAKRLKQR